MRFGPRERPRPLLVQAGDAVRRRRTVIVADHRELAAEWAKRILREPDVIFLDTETTGLGEHAEIVDIAIIDRTGQILLDTLVRPSDVIPPAATDIHGIDDPAVADAPTWDQIYPLVGRILDRYGPVVVYNADFDRRIISQTNRVYGLPDFEAEWHCAMKQHAAYAGIWHSRYETWRWHKLSEALRMMSRPAPGVSHRALADAESCRRIVEAMAERTPVDLPTAEPAPGLTAGSQAGQSPLYTASGEGGPGSGHEPIRPDVVRPGEERHDPADEPGWRASTGQFAGAQYTVISTRSQGCSSGALLLAFVIGVALIAICCCAFFFVAMIFA